MALSLTRWGYFVPEIALGKLWGHQTGIMHLRDYPHYYTKDGKRRAVYYTAEARDLKATGWVREEPKPAKPPVAEKPIPTQEPAKKPEPIKPEVVVEEPAGESEPVFEFMTRSELLKYAMDRGVDLPNNALKAELIDACKAIK